MQSDIIGSSLRPGIHRKPEASGRRNWHRALLAAFMHCDGHRWLLLLKVLLRSLSSLALVLFLVVYSLKYRHRHGNPCRGSPAARKLNLNNCLFSPIAAEERVEVHPFRSSSMSIVEGREESAAEYDAHFRNIEIGASTSGSYNQARRKLGMGGRSNVDLFSTIFQDLIHEGLLKTDHKVLCLGADADEEVLALKEKGVTKTIGVDQAQGSRRKQLFADETFDFEFSTEFDNVPCPALLVAEIERTLKVGGLAAMHVSLATWRERFMSSEFGYQIKPVTLLFRHSKIVYVSTADAPGLDTIIVFKKNPILRPKGTSATKSSNKRGNDNHAMPEAAAVELQSVLKVEGMKSRPIPDVAEPLKHGLYVYLEIGAGDFDHCMSGWFEEQNPKISGSELRARIEREGPFQASYALNSEKFPLYAAWIRNWSVVIGKNFWLQYHSSGDEAMAMMIAEGVELIDWLNKTVVDDDFVVIKMNGDGTNLELVLSRIIETGTISLIDEILLVCQHQTGWKGIILGATYPRSDTECLILYEMLHNSGVVGASVMVRQVSCN